MGVYIIAEAGVNHNGSLDTAKKMVDAAEAAGCDCIKFQTFSADRIVTRSAGRAEYQIRNTGNKDTQYEMLKKLELSADDFYSLKENCNLKGIDFLSTPFDEESADLLESLGVEQYKIPSGEITDRPLIQHIAGFGKKILLSTGMSDINEVSKAVKWIYDTGNHQVVLFHCTSNYPAPYRDVNMKSMITLRDTFGLPVGYSDHTKGIEIALMAVSLGAVMIEKHFTLDRNMEGPDHKASLEPDELCRMTSSIRNIELAFGSAEKKPSEDEMKTRDVARKSLFYCRKLEKGTRIGPGDIICKRPGNGISPEYIDDVIGKTVDHLCEPEDMVAFSDFETDAGKNGI